MNDEELMARMARGSSEDARAALAELYQRYASDVERYVRRLCPDGDTMDCVHETYLAVARNADSFRTGSALPWLLTLASRRALDEQRRKRRRARREESAARSDEEVSPRVDGNLEEQLARLPVNLRAVLELRFVDDLRHEDVARVLGVSLRTAKEWSKRGLEMLRERMENEDE